MQLDLDNVSRSWAPDKFVKEEVSRPDTPGLLCNLAVTSRLCLPTCGMGTVMMLQGYY